MLVVYIAVKKFNFCSVILKKIVVFSLIRKWQLLIFCYIVIVWFLCSLIYVLKFVWEMLMKLLFCLVLPFLTSPCALVSFVSALLYCCVCPTWPVKNATVTFLKLQDCIPSILFFLFFSVYFSRSILHPYSVILH